MFHAQFIHAPDGPRWALHHPARSPDGVRGLVVAVHPFAEEMNKSRRMMAQQARALARDGWHVLQMDLQGCGDSSGSLEQASWETWLDDVLRAVAWLRTVHSRDADRPLWLWGLRSGALVAVEALRRHASVMGPCHLLLWQPFTQGSAQVQQFLRLSMAAALAQGQTDAPGTAAQGTVSALRAQMAAGHATTVAGYTLSADLLRGLDAAQLKSPPQALAWSGAEAPRLVWLEVGRRGAPQLLPASTQALAQWQAAAWTVQAQAVEGPGFWQTTEVETAPQLLEATTTLLRSPQAVFVPAQPVETEAVA